MLSTPPVTFETAMILSLGSGLDFFTGALLPNFQKTVNREFLIMEVQQLEDILSIVRTKFLVWLNVLVLGQTTQERNDVSQGDECMDKCR
jgi:hypothetical protein